MGRAFLLLAPILAVSPALSLAHGGGFDSLGCHNDRRAGEYHCHRGDLAGQTFESKAEAQAALGGARTSAPAREGTDGSDSDAGVPYNRDLYGGWVERAMPDFQERRRRLAENGMEYRL